MKMAPTQHRKPIALRAPEVCSELWMERRRIPLLDPEPIEIGTPGHLHLVQLTPLPEVHTAAAPP